MALLEVVYCDVFKYDMVVWYLIFFQILDLAIEKF